MNLQNPKQLILDNLKEEQSCFKKLIVKLTEQKKAIEDEDEGRVLQIIEEKNIFIETFEKLDKEVEAQLRTLSPEDIQGLAEEGEEVKGSLENLLETIIRMEEECEKKISSKMQEIEKRVIGLQQGKKIGKGYGRFPKIRPLISRKV